MDAFEPLATHLSRQQCLLVPAMPSSASNAFELPVTLQVVSDAFKHQHAFELQATPLSSTAMSMSPAGPPAASVHTVVASFAAVQAFGAHAAGALAAGALAADAYAARAYTSGP
jgi:hypothetical protein